MKKKETATATKQLAPYPLRFEGDLRERLEEAAAKERRSLNFMVNEAIREFLDRGMTG